MNFQRSGCKRIAIFLISISAASIPAMAHADWSIIGLGDLGGNFSRANAINDSGQVTGESFTVNEDFHAFITGAESVGITDVGTLGGDFSRGNAINASGQVAGSSLTAGRDLHAFIIGPDGAGMTDVGNLGSANQVTGVNDSGRIVGEFDPGPNTTGFHAFITGSDGIGMTDLGTLGGEFSSAAGINNSGQVAGWAQTTDSETHAFITGANGTGMTDLGTLDGNLSTATGINSSGQVVGHVGVFTDTLFYHHAFITGPDGVGMTNLGTLGGVFGEALGINDIGEAVGNADTANGDQHAFIYSHGGITDLSLLDAVVAAGWGGLFATDINNNGQIVGVGTNNQGVSEAFLLSYTPDTIFDPNPIFIPPPPPPIPEPQTYAMLLAGLGLLGLIARRRKVITQ